MGRAEKNRFNAKGVGGVKQHSVDFQIGMEINKNHNKIAQACETKV